MCYTQADNQSMMICDMQDTIAFLLSPEARQLRPLLVKELVTGLDYYTRDRLQRAYNSLPSLAPRIPFVGPLPLPPLPSPPLFVPGLGFQPAEQLLQKLAPPLSQTEEVYLQSLLEVASGLLGTDCHLPLLLQLTISMLHDSLVQAMHVASTVEYNQFTTYSKCFALWVCVLQAVCWSHSDMDSQSDSRNRASVEAQWLAFLP